MPMPKHSGSSESVKRYASRLKGSPAAVTRAKLRWSMLGLPQLVPNAVPPWYCGPASGEIPKATHFGVVPDTPGVAA